MKLLPLLLLALAPLSSLANEDLGYSDLLEQAAGRQAPLCYKAENVGESGGFVYGAEGEALEKRTIEAAQKRGCIKIRVMGDFVFADCPVPCTEGRGRRD
jgi:hypothetical protein